MTDPQPDRAARAAERITQIEPVESWGKHALDLRIKGKWVHFHTDYLCVVKQMRDSIEAAFADAEARAQAAEARLAEVEDFLNEVRTSIASEGPHTLERLMAISSLGERTTIIGKVRLAQLHEAEAKLAEVEVLCKRRDADMECDEWLSDHSIVDCVLAILNREQP